MLLSSPLHRKRESRRAVTGCETLRRHLAPQVLHTSPRCNVDSLNSVRVRRSKCGIGNGWPLSVESRKPRSFGGQKSTSKRGEFMVKKTINALVCVLIAPLAFAQTRPTNTGRKTTNQPPTAKTETASGTLTTIYEPGKIIVVGSESGEDTFGLVLDKTVRYVNKAGRGIDEHLIKPGTRIDVYYYGTGETRVVNCVVFDQD